MEPIMLILLPAMGLVILVAYLIFRIGAYRRKIAVIESSRDISGLERETGSVVKSRAPPQAPTIPDGELLMILYKGNRKPWVKTIKEKLSEGRRVVVVSSRDPSGQRSSFRGDSHFIWLDRSTAHGSEKDLTVVNPTNLSSLLGEIKNHSRKGGVVLFMGFEDLLHTNDASRVIRFLKMLDDTCRSGDFSTVVPAPYKAVPQRNRVQITENFETVVI